LKAIAGYCGCPVTTILVQVSAAAATLQVIVKAAHALKQKSRFIRSCSFFR
jgi:hypothetical protein